MLEARPATKSQPPASARRVLTYRRDRFGECWHLVPPGELGQRGRTLCGEPRQGSRLSETYAELRPEPPECVCQRCSEADARFDTEAHR